MRIFILTRQIYGKDLDETVKEYYLAESDREFVERRAPWIVALEPPKLFWDGSEEDYAEVQEEYEEELKATLEAKGRKEIDHEFWLEDVSWESEEITDEEIGVLRKFKIIG